jgi:AcrR family transcriptional regulator
VVGRRERQKEQREARIVRAAARLFATRGYRKTGMQDVARQARLAVGTLYNYFPSKPEIALAIVGREVGAGLAAGEAIVARPPRHPVAAVTALLDAELEPLAGHDRALWRELVSAAMADAAIAARFFASDLRLIGQVDALVRQLQARGDLRRGVDPGRAAIAVYGVFFGWFMAFVTSDAISLDVARDEMRRGVELVMRGVLAGAPGATPPPRRNGPTRKTTGRRTT